METEYECKFAEMRKYIPFLESMIKRLESSVNGQSNPRQAQLSKIRALRDLLLDKNKRMKMENLLKCEQVLVNLYAKVEQNDAGTSQSQPNNEQKNENLDSVRQKLQSVTHNQDQQADWSAPQGQLTCPVVGKETALFQRRPNKNSVPLNKSSEVQSERTSTSGTPKRNYTRVLVSPQRGDRRSQSSDKLFHRRSPRKSPRRRSPSFYKKEKRRSSKTDRDLSSHRRSNDNINITLNVPEKSLSSLNTKDIFERIMNCRDTDVDIDQLSKLRSQILDELKQTGTNQDISDIILKSYEKKKNKAKNIEVEEGELSDSESESIEKIYGNLIIELKNETNEQNLNKEAILHTAGKQLDDQDSRKIKISLIISNAEKDTHNNGDDKNKAVNESNKQEVSGEVVHSEEFIPNCNMKLQEITHIVQDSGGKSEVELVEHCDLIHNKKSVDYIESNDQINIDVENQNSKNSANFYKPLINNPIDTNSSQVYTSDNNKKELPGSSLSDKDSNSCKTSKGNNSELDNDLRDKRNNFVNKGNNYIPFLSDNKKEISEIDILKALKNEILSETIDIPGSSDTPALHQPKLTKVTDKKTLMQESNQKKRISLEKYKEKSSSINKTPLFVKSSKLNIREDKKKHGRGLTEKECERFNFVPKVDIEDITSDEDEKSSSISDVYNDLAPKSPEDDSLENLQPKKPVIIPSDPVKFVAGKTNSDIDMRIVNPCVVNISHSNESILSEPSQNISNDDSDTIKNQNQTVCTEEKKVPNTLLKDPRNKTSIILPTNVMLPTNVSKHVMQTPTYPNMTPNAKSFEISAIDSDEYKHRKHVYAPMCGISKSPRETSDCPENSVLAREKNGTRDATSAKMWENQNVGSNFAVRNDNNKHQSKLRNERDPRFILERRDDFQRSSNNYFGQLECPPTPTHSFGRLDCPSTPVHQFGKSDCPPTPSHSFGWSDCPSTPSNLYSRGECPSTPSHPFGRSEYPTTPSHSFGRADCPTTPSHPFGRSECPTTPSHPFGMNMSRNQSHLFCRSDYPTTPSHSFGRADCPTTPSHPFGRSECPSTPSHPFGRGPGFNQDPRLNRGDDIGYLRDKELNYNRNSNFVLDHKPYTEDNIKYSNDKICERNSFYTEELSPRGNYIRESSIPRREPSVPRTESSVSRSERCISRCEPRREGSIGRPVHRSNESYSSDRTNHRETRMGNNTNIECNIRDHSQRARSVGRNLGRNDDLNNTLAVKSHDRSFTIDTSINRTFQFDTCSDLASFNQRRRRASSVGRSLIRETSIGHSKSIGFERGSERHINKTNFKRAGSVGRDFDPSFRKNYTHSELDFESYKKVAITTLSVCEETSNNKQDKMRDKESDVGNDMNTNVDNPRSRRDLHERNRHKIDNRNQMSAKTNRDPRINREYNYFHKSKYKRDNRFREDRRYNRDNRNYGIVYTSDNIARGTILGSGYGVKNYKIPKIKRAVDDEKIDIENVNMVKNDCKDSSTVKENEMEHIVKSKLSANNKLDKNTITNTKEEIQKNVDKMKNDEIINKSLSNRTRRRKTIISESDTENNANDTDIKNECENITAKENKVADIVLEDEKNKSKLSLDSQDDGSDIFSENIASCSAVTTKIDDLIADLDKDLGNSKEDDEGNNYYAHLNEEVNNDYAQLREEVNNDYAPLKVDSSKIEDKLQDKMSAEVNETSLGDKQHSILHNIVDNESTNRDNDGNKILSSTPINAFENKDQKSEVSESILPQNNISSPTSDVVLVSKSEISSSHDNEKSNMSTSDSEMNVSNIIDNSTSNTCDEDKSIDQCRGDQITSLPDSTNFTDPEQNIDNFSNDYPDITNETQTEMNSVISSTNESKANSTQKTDLENTLKEPSSKADSLENLLSILKNKSKMKEFLSMIDCQSNESLKIKRKLEKLSEIVSDDEEDIPDKVVDADNTEKNYKGVMPSKEETIKVVENAVQSSITEHTNDMNTDSLLNEEDNVGDSLLSCDNETILNRDNEMNIISTKKDVKKKKTKSKGNKVKKLNTPGKTETNKRVTRSETIGDGENVLVKPKKSRELMKLQNDLKDMFISDEVLNSTGIRMCRLAKLVDTNKTNESENISQNKSKGNKKKNIANELGQKDLSPSKIIEKMAGVNEALNNESENAIEKLPRIKTDSNSKLKFSTMDEPNLQKNTVSVVETVHIPKYKPKPKSKKILLLNKEHEQDPYVFESDTFSETTKVSENSPYSSSDSENESLISSKSFGSVETLNDQKKKSKSRKRSWKLGFIKTKTKKKQAPKTHFESSKESSLLNYSESSQYLSSFTDKKYCFSKGQTKYLCRLCGYEGSDIVSHHKQCHPHYEVPLSRISSKIAAEAIKQSEKSNFEILNKLPSKKYYICRFCFEVFDNKKLRLENFFKHVIGAHTGEYKQICTECTSEINCPVAALDIPAPPKQTDGLLLGYICAECNYTQLSLENLKMHVALRHNNIQTEVYTINIAHLTPKEFNSQLTMLQRSSISPRPTRTLRSNQNSSLTEISDDISDTTDVSSHISETENVFQLNSPKKITSSFEKNIASASNILSRISFETDDNSEVGDGKSRSENEDKSIIKVEVQDEEAHCIQSDNSLALHSNTQTYTETMKHNKSYKNDSDQLFTEPHFKLSITESGIKEYVCCINGDNHYKTPLLISMKKHVQLKHKEIWDGYCYICKVIVTPQGSYNFKECFNHFLDKHMDDFALIEKPLPTSSQPVLNISNGVPEDILQNEKPSTAATTTGTKQFINVRPLSQLVSKVSSNNEILSETCSLENTMTLPRIESVVSLNLNQQVQEEDDLPIVNSALQNNLTQYNENDIAPELVQAAIIEEKHQIVLNTMLSVEKLAQVFKCAGNYCSFTSDTAEAALLHASTHQQIGGEGVFRCSYCSFNAIDNGIDLVSHVFREHGHCQFSCKFCFYRATNISLVEAHIKRRHPTMCADDSVIQASNALPPTKNETAAVLSRQDAVPIYICNNGNTSEEIRCKFRHYTPGKFTEHLQQRHADENNYKCSFCSTCVNQPSYLISHLQEHGLHLYQCAWCVHGNDTERGMLDHISFRHPNRKPQAYLRHIIECKDGSTKPKVLPLVHINKTSVTALNVCASQTTDSPVKEAERALNLEKLITTNNTIISKQSTVDNAEQLLATTNSSLVNSLTPTTSTNQNELPESKVTPSETPLTLIIPSSSINDHQQTILTIKKEPNTSTTDVPSLTLKETLLKTKDEVESTANAGNIISLESDEDTKEGILVPNKITDVIDLSDDDTTGDTSLAQSLDVPTTPKDDSTNKYPMKSLFKCGSCNIIFKSANGFVKHITQCYPKKSYINCPYCEFKSTNKKDLVQHYVKMHAILECYICTVCNQEETSLTAIRKHILYIHHTQKFTMKKIETVNEGGSKYFFTPEASTPSKPGPKRKRSIGESAIPTKVKRYGPSDIDSLPINPILDEDVHCSQCEFYTKVRLNMVRHLQQHANQMPVAHTAPVNPVPHLETNEKHFDKMANLAASSNARAPEKQIRSSIVPVVTNCVSPDSAAKYPPYVPERQRHACGAVGCSYISVDEAMLKCHWETLHSETQEFRCVHCPSSQQLDTSRPLTVARVLAHLKMHDAKLYACSLCTYYHYQKYFVEKHLTEKHNSTGKVVVLREPLPPSPASTSTNAAPTMDLKPWQCGLCKFKSMLRPEVVEHCYQVHQSKFQYKCAFCQWRTSTFENVSKHHSTTHPGKIGEVFYFYYREGTLSGEADGSPRWVKQRKQLNVNKASLPLKLEVNDGSPSSQDTNRNVVSSISIVDLNLVKTEASEELKTDYTVEELKRKFGEFCGPKNKKYACPLCNVTVEDTKEAMEAHLYEELNYRKWSCGVCPYKSFHKIRIMDHMFHEHRKTQEPIPLQPDANIERWVSSLLEYQSEGMSISPKDRQDNIPAPTKMPEKSSTPSVEDTSSKSIPNLLAKDTPVAAVSTSKKFSMQELEHAFGAFGAPSNMLFSCPMCNFKVKEEVKMTDHLEIELAKVRWGCSHCQIKFQTYHEVQFHCKSVHFGQSARTVEAPRDPQFRSAWIAAVVQVQKFTMISNSSIKESVSSTNKTSKLVRDESNEFSDVETSDNSLLVPRFEILASVQPAPMRRTRAESMVDLDSDDERLVIDEMPHKTTEEQIIPSNKPSKKCPLCDYTAKSNETVLNHISIKHYKLKPFVCSYCDYKNHRPAVLKHQDMCHSNQPRNAKRVKLPEGSFTDDFCNLNKAESSTSAKKQSQNSSNSKVCLLCQECLTSNNIEQHIALYHPNVPTQLVEIGSIVCKCSICHCYRIDSESIKIHYKVDHPWKDINYTLIKLSNIKKGQGHNSNSPSQKCDTRHHQENTPGLSSDLVITIDSETNSSDAFDSTVRVKRKLDQLDSPQPAKRIAKKSTTKLPFQTRTTARKSTTKLPLELHREYSFYGSKPTPSDDLANVVAHMPFFGNVTFKKLRDFINISPHVLVMEDEV